MTQVPPVMLHGDDDEDNAFASLDAFAQCSVPVSSRRAATEKEAIDYPQRAFTKEGNDLLPKLILLDLNLPTLTGHQFLPLRSEQAFKHVPVLVLSFSESATDIALALQNSANEYLAQRGRRAKRPAPIHDLAVFSCGGCGEQTPNERQNPFPK